MTNYFAFCLPRKQKYFPVTLSFQERQREKQVAHSVDDTNFDVGKTSSELGFKGCLFALCAVPRQRQQSCCALLETDVGADSRRGNSFLWSEAEARNVKAWLVGVLTSVVQDLVSWLAKAGVPSPLMSATGTCRSPLADPGGMGACHLTNQTKVQRRFLFFMLQKDFHGTKLQCFFFSMESALKKKQHLNQARSAVVFWHCATSSLALSYATQNTWTRRRVLNHRKRDKHKLFVRLVLSGTTRDCTHRPTVLERRTCVCPGVHPVCLYLRLR